MDLETKVALLESDVNRMTSLFQRLDTAIEKMGDVSNNIARMLAVHEERLNKQDDTDEELFALVENRRQEIQGDIKELHSRVTSVSRDVSGDINETEQRLISALNTGMADIKKCITEETRILTKNNQELEKRVTALERWKWLVMGGSIAVGAFAHEIVSALIVK
jgi:CRISPR/Cas system-associated protein Cas10 (large subunit of type III CRISPR-Cas system)